jgi:hypothetical protein
LISGENVPWVEVSGWMIIERVSPIPVMREKTRTPLTSARAPSTPPRTVTPNTEPVRPRPASSAP